MLILYFYESHDFVFLKITSILQHPHFTDKNSEADGMAYVCPRKHSVRK